MKKFVVSILAALLLMSLLAVTVVSAANKANKIVVCVLQTNYAESGGEVWYTDNETVLHIRGMTTNAHLEPMPGHPECVNPYATGELAMTLNVDLDMTTGEGTSWGESTLSPAGIDGTFVGKFKGKIIAGSYQGQSTSRGTGALKGLVNKVTIQQTSETTYEVNGYVSGKPRNP